MKAKTIENCLRKSALFQKDFPVTEFTAEPSRELSELYNEVVSAGGIDDPVHIEDYINLAGENMPPMDFNSSIPQLILWYLPVTEEAEEIEETRCLGQKRVIKWKNSAENYHVMEDTNYSNEYTDEMQSVLREALDILAKQARGCMCQSAITEFGILEIRRPIGLNGGSRTVANMANVTANEDLHQTED